MNDGFEIGGICETPWSPYEDEVIAISFIGDSWIITGGADLVFSLGPKLCRDFSVEGKAGEFYAQTTAGYYEIVLYRNGLEYKRLYSFEEPPKNPNAEVVPDLFTDDLFEYSEVVLTVPWEEVESSKWTALTKLPVEQDVAGKS